MVDAEDMGLRARLSALAVSNVLVAVCAAWLGRRAMSWGRPERVLRSGAANENPSEDREADTPGDPKGYELAYEAGIRAVEGQESALHNIRSRAATLLTLVPAVFVSGVVGAGLVLEPGQRLGDALGYLGIAGLIVAAISLAGATSMGIKSLWPAEAQFGLDTRVIIRDYVERQPPASLSKIHRELARWLGEHADFNHNMLSKKLSVLSWGWIFLMLSMIGALLVIGDLVYG